MDAGNMGYGAGGGLLSALLVWAGFKQRLDRADADIFELKKAVMYKDIHEVCAAAHCQSQVDVNKKLDYIVSRIDKIGVNNVP